MDWLSHQGQFPLLSRILLQFALGMGLVGILQHYAFNREQPHTELQGDLPLLVTKQHCRSALWRWCHPSKLCVCALSPSVMMTPAPSNTEKRPHINGHASPSHLAANVGNNHAGKQSKSQCLLLLYSFFLSALIWLHCHWLLCVTSLTSLLIFQLWRVIWRRTTGCD